MTNSVGQVIQLLENDEEAVSIARLTENEWKEITENAHNNPLVVHEIMLKKMELSLGDKTEQNEAYQILKKGYQKERLRGRRLDEITKESK